MTFRPETLGALTAAGYRSESVADELRRNAVRKLAAREPLFRGIVGYDDTVIPQIINAILARQSFILLGTRGQAKTRLLRGLVNLLDPEIPVLAETEIPEDPLNPITAQGKQLVREHGDQTRIRWLPREARYVEKLATPDVTIADLIGDLDPIKAAKQSLTLSDDLVMQFGLLPRAHRGIFALNELPDLAAKIQVGLFNILEEGDVQIKGFPVRLPLDVVMVFSANPEDYTARGKIITPLKDRIGAEIRTHAPATVAEGAAITQQEAWTDRPETPVVIPDPVREIVEAIAFAAREDRRVDKRAGVSQRLPIALLELATSNAERRALTNGESPVVVRILDIYAALPAITGKIELEYEGEQVGADRIARELIRQAAASVFSARAKDVDTRAIIDGFRNKRTVEITEGMPVLEVLAAYKRLPGLLPAASLMAPTEDPGATVVAAELLLEGLYALKKLSRAESRDGLQYSAGRPKEGRSPSPDDENFGNLN